VAARRNDRTGIGDVDSVPPTRRPHKRSAMNQKQKTNDLGNCKFLD
jgi:hypothetical protein